jgi:tRNA dimethylallyltransferase
MAYADKSMARPQPLLVIVGETASGKSALAMELAKRFDGEIISADSWTVRRGVDIGTAKPTAAERQMVPHHLLDVVGPDKDFTAAVFKKLAQQAITDISNRGKLPIMVGGTGLYIDGVLFDYSFLPASDQKLRQQLNDMTIPGLLKRIKDNEIELGDVDIRNKRRLIRLIENDGILPTKHELRDNTLVIGLRSDRQELEERITKRVDGMLAAGLEQEVKVLVGRYGWQAEGLKGIGYAQWQDYFSGRKNLAETRSAIIKATQDLAKRQRTWFRRNNCIQWFSTPVNQTDVVELVTTFLER